MKNGFGISYWLCPTQEQGEEEDNTVWRLGHGSSAGSKPSGQRTERSIIIFPWQFLKTEFSKAFQKNFEYREMRDKNHTVQNKYAAECMHHHVSRLMMDFNSTKNIISYIWMSIQLLNEINLNYFERMQISEVVCIFQFIHFFSIIIDGYICNISIRYLL